MKKILIIALSAILLWLVVPSGVKEFGARTMAPLWNRADLDVSVEVGDFTNASTTVIAVQNPHGATSTLDLFFYNQTGVATSTYTLACGTSTNAFIAPSVSMVNNISVATNSKAIIANGITNGPGFSSAGASVQTAIGVAPNEYFVCKVTSAYPGAFTEVTNTYTGAYTLRFNKITN